MGASSTNPTTAAAFFARGGTTTLGAQRGEPREDHHREELCLPLEPLYSAEAPTQSLDAMAIDLGTEGRERNMPWILETVGGISTVPEKTQPARPASLCEYVSRILAPALVCSVAGMPHTAPRWKRSSFAYSRYYSEPDPACWLPSRCCRRR